DAPHISPPIALPVQIPSAAAAVAPAMLPKAVRVPAAHRRFRISATTSTLAAENVVYPPRKPEPAVICQPRGSAMLAANPSSKPKRNDPVRFTVVVPHGMLPVVRAVTALLTMLSTAKRVVAPNPPAILTSTNTGPLMAAPHEECWRRPCQAMPRGIPESKCPE